MRKFAIFIATLFSFAACDLNKLEPAQTKAFMKYFGDVGNTTGVDLLKLDDGYLLLGNNAPPTGPTRAVLIKVDPNGNQLWTNNFPGIEGSALAMSANGYFIVGDSIDITNPLNTSMSLIKTNLEGTKRGEAYLGEAGKTYHGTGVTVGIAGTTTDEVVVCGYIEDVGNNNYQTFLYGYNQDLTPTWTSLRKYPPSGIEPTISSNKLIEILHPNSDSEFMHTKVVSTTGGPQLRAFSAPPDSENPLDDQPLFQSYTISSNMGGSNSTSTGAVMVQTVNNGNGIALATYSSGNEQSNVLIEESGNSLFANAVIESGSNAVILGSTNKHSDESTRSDLDFYITNVGITNGVVSKTSGFKTYIGGTGNETGAAIVKADDGGYVFLGTMINTNGVSLMVLGKVNSKGELIN